MEDPFGEVVMVEDVVADPNSGGRVRFTLGDEVRYIEMSGTISSVHIIDQERSDRKGFISLKEKIGTRIVRIHHRRLLPLNMDGKAVVIESQDQLWALCPDDGQVMEVFSGDTSITCLKCSKTFSLHWIGVKAMAETKEKTAKAETAPKAAKAEKAVKAAPKVREPKPPREPKAPKEAVKVNLDYWIIAADAEFSSAVRATFTGSTIPIATMSVSILS